MSISEEQILESFKNGQRKQAFEQFKELSPYDQEEFLRDMHGKCDMFDMDPVILLKSFFKISHFDEG